MADSIGGFPFINISGFPDIPGLQFEQLTRPGVSGNAYRQLGRRGKEFALRTICDPFKINMQTLKTNLNNMRGTTPTLVINGTTYTGYFCLDVGEWEEHDIGASVGGVYGGNSLLRATFKMVYPT
jgi:hypothetical protein